MVGECGKGGGAGAELGLRLPSRCSRRKRQHHMFPISCSGLLVQGVLAGGDLFCWRHQARPHKREREEKTEREREERHREKEKDPTEMHRGRDRETGEAETRTHKPQSRETGLGACWAQAKSGGQGQRLVRRPGWRGWSGAEERVSEEAQGASQAWKDPRGEGRVGALGLQA